MKIQLQQMNYKIKKLVREIKAAVMLNVSLMNQI